MKKQKEFEPDFLNIPYVVMHMQPADRFTFGAIYLFSNLSQKRCIASNVELGRIAKITPESVSNSLNHLEDEGFIKRHFKDNNKRTRDWIEVLVGFVKIPSENGIDTIHKWDKIPSTDEHIKNIDKETVVEDNKDETFNLDTEVQRLLDYKGEKFYFLNIMGIFIKRKKPDIRNKKQFNKFVKDYTWAAKQLEIYDNDQIIKAIKEAEQMIDTKTGKQWNWDLASVIGKIKKITK